MTELKFEDLKCTKCGKTEIETDKEDSTTYFATFERKDKESGEFLSLSIRASSPIDAKQGEDNISFKSYTDQKNIADAVRAKNSDGGA